MPEDQNQNPNQPTSPTPVVIPPQQTAQPQVIQQQAVQSQPEQPQSVQSKQRPQSQDQKPFDVDEFMREKYAANPKSAKRGKLLFYGIILFIVLGLAAGIGSIFYNKANNVLATDCYNVKLPKNYTAKYDSQGSESIGLECNYAISVADSDTKIIIKSGFISDLKAVSDAQQIVDLKSDQNVGGCNGGDLSNGVTYTVHSCINGKYDVEYLFSGPNTKLGNYYKDKNVSSTQERSVSIRVTGSDQTVVETAKQLKTNIHQSGTILTDLFYSLVN